MKHSPRAFSLLVCGFLSALSLPAAVAQDPLAPPAAKPVPAARADQVPDVAAPKVGGDGQPHKGFIQLHDRFVAIAKAGKGDLLFLGDSITAGWSKEKATWEKAFGAYKPINFGIGGDCTQHVLWRIENGELAGIKPKVVVLMIGTNNTKSDSGPAIASGVTKIVQTIQAKLPTSKVLLLAIFPRGATPNPARTKIGEANKIIAKLADGRNVFFLDIGDKLMEADGTITKEVMPDSLHLSGKGYQIWAEAMSPKLAELMR